MHKFSIALSSAFSDDFPEFKDPFTITSAALGIGRRSVKQISAFEDPDVDESGIVCPTVSQLPACKSVIKLPSTSEHVPRSVPPEMCDRIRLIIHELYRNGQRIVLSRLNDMLKDELGKDGYSYGTATLWRVLKGIGFSYRRVSDRSILYEKPDLVKLRHSYLSKIKEYRNQGHYIAYLDETWIFEGMRCSMDWVDKLALGMFTFHRITIALLQKIHKLSLMLD